MSSSSDVAWLSIICFRNITSNTEMAAATIIHSMASHYHASGNSAGLTKLVKTSCRWAATTMAARPIGRKKTRLPSVSSRRMAMIPIITHTSGA